MAMPQRPAQQSTVSPKTAHSRGEPFSPMTDVYLILTAIVESTFNQPIFRGHREAIVDTLRSAIAQLRGYVVQSTDDLVPRWNVIRGNVPATDFLMDVTIQLHMSLAGSPLPYDALAMNLAQAMSAHRASNAGVVIDRDLYSRMPDPKTAQELLVNNPWFVTLLLLSYRPDLLNG